VEAERTANGATVKTQNVTGLTLSIPPGYSTWKPNVPTSVTLDGQALKAGPVMSDRSWSVTFSRTTAMASSSAIPLTARRLSQSHGLQGPIDDAFMDRFIFVRPTGKPINPKVGEWVTGELGHAIEHWRRQFRGR